MSTWRPQRKVTVAGLSGPVITAGLAWMLPNLPAPGIAFGAALGTALIAYWTKPARETAPNPEMGS